MPFMLNGSLLKLRSQQLVKELVKENMVYCNKEPEISHKIQLFR